MTSQPLTLLLQSLLAQGESEVVEFKEAGDGYSLGDIGKYFSALANEANLRGMEKAWLVFGVNDKTRLVKGTDYRPEPDRLQNTKMQIADGAEPSVTFRNIHELFLPEGRVVLFEIPAAPRGIPVAWQGHFYGRAASSLTSLGVDKLDEIRQQTLSTDWSAQIVAGATIADLDEAAVQKARESFSRKYANRFTAEEMAGWSLPTFLDRAKVTQNGQITRSALLLLGKPESAHKLSPHPAQMTWKLEGTERAYEHFGTPFLLTTTQLYQRIRNIQIRLLPAGQMIPHEVSKYDQKIVLEALHNCIAHQDYMRNGRINVIEKPEKLIFENEGSFYEGQPDDYVLGEKMPRRYRNPFLVQAMVELGMIDTMGYGIHRMNTGQAKRYFPLPDYDLSEANAVRMVIYGGVVDPAYSQMLMQKTDLPFVDVLALDRVQKKLPIPDETIARLRRSGAIEGRKPNFHVSAAVAAATATKAEYIRTRPQHDSHYQKLILDYIEKNKAASRKEIDDLLWKILSEALDDTQKSNKIGNLLTNLRRAGDIHNAGNRKAPIWKIAEKMQNKIARLQKEP
jgi:ATP-dependent DNA helicase RecG